MANPSKAKGTRYESGLVKYWKERGLSARRKVMAGNMDQGDICVGEWLEWTFEAKDRKRLDLAGAVDEANAEAKNADTKYGVAVLKRAGMGMQHSYVVMDLDTFTRMMTDD